MFLLVFLLAMVGTVLCQRATSDRLFEENFPPIHSNCSQSLTDLLLLRQEFQLHELKQAEGRSLEILREAVALLTDIRDSKANHRGEQGSCPENFLAFGGTCLFLAKDIDVTWEAAQDFCHDLGSDLVVFKDANQFAAGLSYIKSSDLARKSNIWIGGRDNVVEGEWKWITGEPMPRGTPFWGHISFKREPQGGDVEQCAILWGTDEYMFHDCPCSWKCKPLCQVQLS